MCVRTRRVATSGGPAITRTPRLGHAHPISRLPRPRFVPSSRAIYQQLTSFPRRQRLQCTSFSTISKPSGRSGSGTSGYRLWWRSTVAVKPQLGRVRAYQPYANALRQKFKHVRMRTGYVTAPSRMRATECGCVQRCFSKRPSSGS